MWKDLRARGSHLASSLRGGSLVRLSFPICSVGGRPAARALKHKVRSGCSAGTQVLSCSPRRGSPAGGQQGTAFLGRARRGRVGTDGHGPQGEGRALDARRAGHPLQQDGEQHGDSSILVTWPGAESRSHGAARRFSQPQAQPAQSQGGRFSLEKEARLSGRSGALRGRQSRNT